MSTVLRRPRRPSAPARGAKSPLAAFPPPPAAPIRNPGLSRAQLLEIHRHLRLNRMVEEKLSALYRQGRIHSARPTPWPRTICWRR